MKTHRRPLATLFVTVFAALGLAQAQDKPAKTPADPAPSAIKKAAPTPNQLPVKKTAGDPGPPAQVKKTPADPAKPAVKKTAGDPGQKPAAPGGKKPGPSGAGLEFSQILDRCDADGDRAVSLAEFQQQRSGKDPASVENWFRTRDRDQDGRLTEADFAPHPGNKS